MIDFLIIHNAACDKKRQDEIVPFFEGESHVFTPMHPNHGALCA